MAINGVSVNNANEEHINYDNLENRIASAEYSQATNVLTFRDEEGTQKFNVEVEQDMLELDDTLSREGYAADAKAVGDEITRVESAIPNIDSTLSTNGDAADAGATGAAITNAISLVMQNVDDVVDDMRTELQEDLDKLDSFYLYFLEQKTSNGVNLTGDCSLIKIDDTNAVLVDFGTNDSTTNNIAYIRSKGITSIPYGIISHMHSDHIGSGTTASSLYRLASEFNMHTIYLPEEPDWSSMVDGNEGIQVNFATEYDNIEAIAEELNINLVYPSEGQTVSIGKGNLTFFNCTRLTYNDGDYYNSKVSDSAQLNTTVYNNFSMCVKYEQSGSVTYFTGDIEKTAQEYLTSIGRFSNCLVLKCPHHLMNTFESLAFWKTCASEYAIAMASTANRAGVGYYLAKESSKNFYVATETGSVCIEANSRGVNVTTEKSGGAELSTLSDIIYMQSVQPIYGSLYNYYKAMLNVSNSLVYGYSTNGSLFTDLPPTSLGIEYSVRIEVAKIGNQTYDRFIVTYTHGVAYEIWYGYLENSSATAITWSKVVPISYSQFDGLAYPEPIFTIVSNSYVSNTDGSFIEYNNWERTDYIEIDSTKKYVIEKKAVAGYSIYHNAYYDENHNVIHVFNVDDGKNVITFPSNAKYIALSDRSGTEYKITPIYSSN